MVDPFSVALGAVPVATGGLVWLIRLEGRLNTHEATDLVVHTNVEKQLTKIDASAVRMETKLDTLLGRPVAVSRHLT